MNSKQDSGALISSLVRRPWVIGLGLLAVTFLAYQPVWHAGFIWDDDEFVWNNPVFKSPHCLRLIWITPTTTDYFPMTYSLLWVEWPLWGNHAPGYHLVNVLLHGLSALLLWRAMRCLRFPGAFLAAAIFALHPVNVESVAWIAEVKNALAMFFYAGTILAWVKFEDSGQWRWYAVALAGFALALLSKTAVASLPIVLLALAAWRQRRLDWNAIRQVAPFFVVAAALALVTVLFTHRVIGTYVIRADSFWSRLAVAGCAVWFYLYKAVLPLKLAAVYPRWQIDPTNPLSYVPLLLLLAAFVLCWRFRKRWGTGPFLALVCFVAMLLPILGFFDIPFMRLSLVADHWEYFAIIAPIALVAAVIRRVEIAAALLVVLGALTWKQCGMYTNIETFWETTLRQDPNSWVAECELGTLLRQRGDFTGAVSHFQRSIELNPKYGKSHTNLGFALLQEGKTAEAIAEFKDATQLEPTDPGAANNLAWILASNSDVSLRDGPQAVTLAERANSLTGGDKPIILHTLAAAYAQAGRYTEAVTTARHALDLAQAQSNAWLAGQLEREISLYQSHQPFPAGTR